MKARRPWSMPSTRVPAPVRTAVAYRRSYSAIEFLHRTAPQKSVACEYGVPRASAQGRQPAKGGRLQVFKKQSGLHRQDAPGAGEAETERHGKRDEHGGDGDPRLKRKTQLHHSADVIPCRGAS